MKDKILGIIVTIIIIIWLLTFLISMEIGYIPLGILCFGLFFSLCGIGTLKSKQYIGIVFIIIGVIAISYSISAMFGTNLIGHLLAKYFGHLFGLVFFIAGLVLFLFALIRDINYRKKYPIKVKATLVNINEDKIIVNGKKIVQRNKTYTYELEGKEYNTQTSNADIPDTNEIVAYINKEFPEELHMPLNYIVQIFLYSFGLLFMTSGLAIFICFCLKIFH